MKLDRAKSAMACGCAIRHFFFFLSIHSSAVHFISMHFFFMIKHNKDKNRTIMVILWKFQLFWLSHKFPNAHYRIQDEKRKRIVVAFLFFYFIEVPWIPLCHFEIFKIYLWLQMDSLFRNHIEIQWLWWWWWLIRKINSIWNRRLDHNKHKIIQINILSMAYCLVSKSSVLWLTLLNNI